MDKLKAYKNNKLSPWHYKLNFATQFLKFEGLETLILI